MTDEPTPGEKLDAALAKFKEAAAQVSVTATAQGAFGWMMRGDLMQARATLAKLPRERLLDVGVAAAALSSLAEEVAAEAEGSNP
ncbi:hypothetical protein IU487_22250 [Nocardia puris]|uniref:hypothetical protein n=1 Tax=Nocardia puris TaxID=208602 RepID=UPI001893EE43|nr:hypothetical protein [Nocardia puris]MBF6213742.1 hypothetical protein [Nocardia puris]